MAGKGTPKKKIATKAAAASASMARFFKALDPTRTTACSTIARTAALRPKNSAATMPTSPKPA
jgi:hypothetical protein